MELTLCHWCTTQDSKTASQDHPPSCMLNLVTYSSANEKKLIKDYRKFAIVRNIIAKGKNIFVR